MSPSRAFVNRRIPVLGVAPPSFVDWVFFVLGGVSAVWLATILIRESFRFGWWQLQAGQT